MNGIEELRRLSAEATPGPWVVKDADDEPYVDSDFGVVAQVFTTYDAALIAEARNHLDALLDVAQAARACFDEQMRGWTPVTPRWVNTMADLRDKVAALERLDQR